MLEKKDVCSKFDSITKVTKTKENYLAKYRIDIFSYKEFSTANAKFISDYVMEGARNSYGGFVLSAVNYSKKNYSPNDYIVIGDICRDPKSEVHIGGKYIFILRKTPKGFKIVGLEK